MNDSSSSTTFVSTPIDLFFTILINIANVIGILYNIPQMIHTYRIKRADDISALFLNLRTLCSIIWIVYSIYYQLWYVLISFASSLISSLFISYYRFEILQNLFKCKKKVDHKKEIKSYAEMIQIPEITIGNNENE
jgi:uncharacterized protein with PQ loop repeat